MSVLDFITPRYPYGRMMMNVDERAEAAWNEYLTTDDPSPRPPDPHWALRWAHRACVAGFKARDNKPSETDLLLAEAAELLARVNKQPGSYGEDAYLGFVDAVTYLRQVVSDCDREIGEHEELGAITGAEKKGAASPKPTKEEILADCDLEIEVCEEQKITASAERLHRIKQYIEETW